MIQSNFSSFKEKSKGKTVAQLLVVRYDNGSVYVQADDGDPSLPFWGSHERSMKDALNIVRTIKKAYPLCRVVLNEQAEQSIAEAILVVSFATAIQDIMTLIPDTREVAEIGNEILEEKAGKK